MNETLPRVRAGQPVADDGSCWRSLYERQQALIDAQKAKPEPGYTAGAVEAMDAGDPKPKTKPARIDYAGPEPAPARRWPLFVLGVMCGAVACAWVMTP